MSDLDLTEAVEAASREVSKQARCWPEGDNLLHDVIPFEAADAAVRTAASLIERQVRERVAQEIEARIPDVSEGSEARVREVALFDAAAIARGGAS